MCPLLDRQHDSVFEAWNFTWFLAPQSVLMLTTITELGQVIGKMLNNFDAKLTYVSF